MMRSLWSAASGMIAQQTNVDTISHNIANVNTTGYKTEKTEFKSLLYQNIQARTTTANGEHKPVPAQVGLGTRVASNTSIFTQGALLASENDTSFAIDGEGFFAVRGGDGEVYYTRNGSFNWSMAADGGVVLTTSDGYPVLDTKGQEIRVPKGIATEKVKASGSGQFYYTDATGNAVTMNQSFGIYQFNNPAGLEKLSDSLLAVTDASGNPLNEATTNGLTPSKVRQGYLEGSNVQVADEMVNLIVAQRAYELNSKAIQAADAMLEQANQLRR